MGEDDHGSSLSNLIFLVRTEWLKKIVNLSITVSSIHLSMYISICLSVYLSIPQQMFVMCRFRKLNNMELHAKFYPLFIFSHSFREVSWILRRKITYVRAIMLRPFYSIRTRVTLSLCAVPRRPRASTPHRGGARLLVTFWMLLLLLGFSCSYLRSLDSTFSQNYPLVTCHHLACTTCVRGLEIRLLNTCKPINLLWGCSSWPQPFIYFLGSSQALVSHLPAILGNVSLPYQLPRQCLGWAVIQIFSSVTENVHYPLLWKIT